MLKLLKDPLLHFLAIGAALFAISALRGGDGEAPERIVVSAAEVERLRAAAEVMQRRPPTRDELLEMLEPTIRDEVFYREALALGLDENDDEVRRRLIEKMQYLTQNLADPEPPSDEALREFYASSPARFTIPERVTFDQVFFSPSQRGDALERDVAEALDALRGGADPAGVGDRTPLELRFEQAGRDRVSVLFGEEMTNALFTMTPGGWTGPYRSDFGLHLVRLVERLPARLPPFEEAREQVREIYAAEKRAARNEQEYARMRARYDVVIEWPEGIE
ncbi:MAG TPA: peptidylprolyl isomerase [Gammaproteobacteria bacterium]